MQWHTLPVASAPLQNPDAFETEALLKADASADQLFAAAATAPATSCHIWANGYQAGYYAYLWTEMLDDAAFQWFLDNGGMTRANGDRFRKMVLSRGNTEDLDKMYNTWLGGKPGIETDAEVPRAEGLGE